MSRFIFVTGGVVSSLGKGITSASLATLLEARGLNVTLIKMDPYVMWILAMSPYQHGEVFVTEDGAETDLDLGHYERFIRTRLSRATALPPAVSIRTCWTRASTWAPPSKSFPILPTRSS